MRRQLPLDLWNDPDRAVPWDSFPEPDRDRAIDLFTRLALRAVREARTPGADDRHDLGAGGGSQDEECL